MTDWATALDRFEQQLQGCRAVLDHDAEPNPEPWPPADLTSEPIPAGLVRRAQTLLSQASDLEEELVARRAAIPELRTPVRHRRRSFASISTKL